jgi:hypothetical protein
VALDQLMVESNTRFAMVLRSTGKSSHCPECGQESQRIQQPLSALGGSAGSRLAQQLGILAGGSTLLRQLRRKLMKPSAQQPRVLGIDDWAWRKGHRYGTILCDLERGKVVDLMPDRSPESTAQWLRAHPGREIVSRDRASWCQHGVTHHISYSVWGRCDDTLIASGKGAGGEMAGISRNIDNDRAVLVARLTINLRDHLNIA